MDLIKIRKDLHQIPELGFEEYETQKYLLSILKKYDALVIHTFDFTGILLEYRNGNGSYRLVRADMDALPIEENTGCDFSSKHKGRMHACGHDVHMTILLGLIDDLMKIKPKQNILFLFQPAEEVMSGADRVIKAGILDKYEIDEAYALHVSGVYPVGTVASKAGIFFANTQEINVKIKGVSAHVAFPEKGHNALAAGVEFYHYLKQKLADKLSSNDRYVCEFGKMQAGSVMNVIAEDCFFEGTARAFSMDTLDLIKETLCEVAEIVANKFEVKIDIIYNAFYKSVENNDALVERLKRVCKADDINYIASDAVLTGEDFGYFTHVYPGLLFWLGVNDGEKQYLHADTFLPSEKAIPIGVKLFKKLIIKEN